MSKKDEDINLFEEDQPNVEDVEATAALEAEGKPSKEEFVVPDKFKDKSLEDVITSYTNLESEYGRKNNEVGELRKLTDDILRQSVAGKAATDVQSNEVGFDELIEDPNAAIDKALSKNPRLAALEAGVHASAQATAHKAILARHADADTLVASAEFQNWVGKSPSRARMFSQASDSLDADMAAEIIDLYKGTVKSATDAATELRDNKASESLKLATNEKGGKKAVQSKKVYKRAELIRLKISDPRRYESMRTEINAAYKEGRVK